MSNRIFNLLYCRIDIWGKDIFALFAIFRSLAIIYCGYDGITAGLNCFIWFSYKDKLFRSFHCWAELKTKQPTHKTRLKENSNKYFVVYLSWWQSGLNMAKECTYWQCAGRVL